MGTWSTPLFVSVAPGNPEDYHIDTTKLSSETIESWRKSAFLQDIYNTTTKKWVPQTSYTLDEFMDTGCDTHKLLDYVDNEKITMWLDMFTHMLGENPTLEHAQFHFFCTDSQEP